jgi:putative phosphoesterase
MQRYNILVMSDSHGNRQGIENALQKQKTPLDGIIHLGDGCRDLQYCNIPPNCAVFTVRGNCDIMVADNGRFAYERVVNFGEFKFLMIHGHRLAVKDSTVNAIEYANSLSVDVLLFGHTHIPTEQYYQEGSVVGKSILRKPLYVFNPGSVGKYPYTFGNIQIIENNIVFGIAK